MDNIVTFTNRNDFREWLRLHCQSEDGIWLLFGKTGGPITLSANDALEEALCFGWIDGKMQSIDECSYQKYFAQRRKHSKWSNKNKDLVAQLEQKGSMTDFGRAKIAEAKENGQWDIKKVEISDEDIQSLTKLLEAYELAYTNFLAMSPSVKKTYTRAYLDAKTDEGREKRITWMVDRLNKNLKPM